MPLHHRPVTKDERDRNELLSVLGEGDLALVSTSNSRASAVIEFDEHGYPQRTHDGFCCGTLQLISPSRSNIDGTIMPNGSWAKKMTAENRRSR
jgi:hypothetical protein